MPFTLSGKTGKLVIEVTEDSKEKKNKVYTYTLFYGSDERRADFLTDGTAEDHPDLAVRSRSLSPHLARCVRVVRVTLGCAAIMWCSLTWGSSACRSLPQAKTAVTAGAPRDIDGTMVQYYTLSVNGRAVDKRFKDFDTIYRLLRSAYAEAPVR